MKTHQTIKLGVAFIILIIVAFFTLALKVLTKFDKLQLPSGLQDITVDSSHSVKLQAWRTPEGPVKIVEVK